MEKKDIFSFFNQEHGIALSDNVYVAYMQNIYSWDDLLNKYYLELKFPSYFGFNLNALYDCLLDFNWMSEKNIFIVHRELPKISEFKDYLEILGEAVLIWSRYPEEHVLKVFFDNTSRDEINHMVDEIDFYGLTHHSPVFPPF